MKFLRLLIVPLFAGVLLTAVDLYVPGAIAAQDKEEATPLLFAAGSIYSPQVVTSQQTNSAHSNKPVEYYYVCPMHDNVKYKKPGKCPKCKMTLEKRQVKEPTASTDQ
jgi:hypothetical protein